MTNAHTHEELDTRGQLRDPELVKKYVLAGHATITLVSMKTRNRFTYEINETLPDDAGKLGAVSHFVSLLVNPDNEHGFKYFGHVFRRDGNFVVGKKSKISADAPGVKAFAWFFEKVVVMRQDPASLGLEVWHEGRCAKCGRKLTVPESVERGIGPECWSRMNGD
jgi:hypothetical protein